MWIKNFTILIFILSIAYLNAVHYPTYEHHYCLRDCSEDTRQLECVYNFTVEWFMSFSYDCLNCPENIEDCYRPSCIVLAGLQRPVRVVNRMLPGPKIQVCERDMIVINVHNKLNLFESITIHGHGIHQRGYQYMDGVGMLTQCPIVPLTTFQYKYGANNRGTHWWHAHTSIHRTDGVFGPLIIREANDVNRHLYDYDLSEHVISIIDMTKKPLATKLEFFIFAMGNENITFITINGKGIDIDKPESKNPRAEFYVSQGSRYRFRIISAGAQFCPFEFSIEQHELTVIATDGNPIKPQKVKSVILMSAERFDVVIEANQPVANYWIKVRGLGDCVSNERYQTAILRYDEKSIELPFGTVTYDSSGPDVPGLTLNPSNLQINETNNDAYMSVAQLKSNKADKEEKYLLKKIKGKVNKKLYITVDMNVVQNPEFYDNETFEAALQSGVIRTSPQMNNITFKFPKYPVYYQKKKNPENIFCNKKQNLFEHCDENGFCSCTHRIKLDLNDVVEIFLIDTCANQVENHPIHLHGHAYAVVALEKFGDNITVGEIKKLDIEGKIKRNLHNPPFKDTVQVPCGGTSVIRFVANNPGTWFMHCHIDFHAEEGMAMIFKTGDENDLPPAPECWPQCDDFKVENDYPEHLY